MSNSRRNFCKNSVYIGLGLSFFPLITHAKANQTISGSVINLRMKAHEFVKVNGIIRYKDSSPVKNATIEIWHNNSEKSPLRFEYDGKLTTDSEGNYSFESDFPEKHYEDGYFSMRRIYFKIKDQNGDVLLTKLYFGYDGKALVDHFHVNLAPEKFKTILPKTKFEASLFTVQFDIYLDSKVATNFA